MMMHMKAITIPKELANQDELVVIPKKEYDEFLKVMSIIRFVEPDKVELKTLERGRREIKAGKYTPWKTFKNELAYSRRRSSKKAD